MKVDPFKVEIPKLGNLLFDDRNVSVKFLHDRPLTMHRFPEGVGGEGFFEKDAPAGTPPYVDIFTRHSETAGRYVHFVICNNLDTLIWIANLASLEIHTTLSTTAAYESPDLLLFDIDPEPPLTFEDVVDVAHVVRSHLEDRGLRPYVKISGKKGVHIVVPLVSGSPFAAVRDFAHGVGKEIARDTPRVVSEFFGFGTGFAFVFKNLELFPGGWHVRQTGDYDRVGGSRVLDRFTAIVEHRAHFAGHRAHQHRVADAQRAVLH